MQNGMPSVTYIGHMSPLPHDMSLYDQFIDGDETRINLKRRALMPKGGGKRAHDNLIIRELSVTVSAHGRDMNDTEVKHVMMFFRKYGVDGITAYEPGNWLEHGHYQGMWTMYATSSMIVKSRVHDALDNIRGDANEYACSLIMYYRL